MLYDRYIEDWLAQFETMSKTTDKKSLLEKIWKWAHEDWEPFSNTWRYTGAN